MIKKKWELIKGEKKRIQVEVVKENKRAGRKKKEIPSKFCCGN